MTSFQNLMTVVIPALEAGTSVRRGRIILHKVPGSPRGNDEI